MTKGSSIQKRSRDYHRKRSVAYRNINFVKLLTDHHKNPKQIKKLIKYCTDNEINAITEIIYNFLQGHLKCDIKKFKKQAGFLRLVGNKYKSLKTRRRAILSKGSGLLSLLTIAVPALIKLFGNS